MVKVKKITKYASPTVYILKESFKVIDMIRKTQKWDFITCLSADRDKKQLRRRLKDYETTQR